MLTHLLGTLRREGSVMIAVRIHANAKRTMMREILDDGSVKIDVAAPPEDSRANEELLRFVAESFHVPIGCVQLLSGQTSRRKMLRITCAP